MLAIHLQHLKLTLWIKPSEGRPHEKNDSVPLTTTWLYILDAVHLCKVGRQVRDEGCTEGPDMKLMSIYLSTSSFSLSLSLSLFPSSPFLLSVHVLNPGPHAC
jgi:hypothetical protein